MSSLAKKKIFLGAYINYTNAQNLNCLSLAKYLNKEKFEVYALEVYSGNLVSEKIPGLHVFRCFYPHRISRYLGYLWGIMCCDVAYLPKGELVMWNRFWLKLLRKKSFSTLEGIVITNLSTVYQGIDKFYAITEHIKDVHFRGEGFSTEKKILYLGVEVEHFFNPNKHIEGLNKIIFIGRLLKRKGLYDLLELARSFPLIDFYIVGDGDPIEKAAIIEDAQHIENIEFMGVLSHSQLSHLLRKCDLHVFPSRQEGFPKVTLEAAVSGVPSVVYSDYGAAEWIRHGYDGFVVDTLDQMRETIQHLYDHPSLLQQASQNAVEMAKRFDWNVLIKEWEEEIESFLIDVNGKLVMTVIGGEA